MADPHLARVRRIMAKLESVRLRNLSCFGSDTHGFRMNRPISDAELAEFETRHRIRLPSDYRAFLMHAGNGGAGPYYGIFSLEKWSDFAEWVLDEVPEGFLARPCPLVPGRNQTEQWASRPDVFSPYQGTLSLGSQGCTYAMQLAVTGPYAGRVVYVDADGGPPYMVHEPDFLSWYERWLDELLQGYKTDWFGYGPGGGEDDFFRILNDPQASDDFKSEAAGAFCRLPWLSDDGAFRIAAYCRDPLSGVRSGACATIRSLKIHHAVEEAARLLDDRSADVRRQAVWTVMELDPQRWTNAVLRRLREDPDQEVATSAFFKLKDAGALSKAELLRIVASSPLENLRYLAAHAVTWAGEDLELLVRLLSDSNAQVRFYATLGLRQLKARSALPQILELLARENDDLVVGSILNMLGELGDPSVVPNLLEWARASDDFHRLEAIEAIAKIGDERALPVAKGMLQEHRPPVRRNAHGLTSLSSIHTISDLARKSLKASPNRKLRALAR